MFWGSRTVTDEKGEKYYPFSIKYFFQDSAWTFTLYAKSWEEAEERLSNLHFARVDGEIKAEFPVRGWLSRFLLWFHRMAPDRNP